MRHLKSSFVPVLLFAVAPVLLAACTKPEAPARSAVSATARVTVYKSPACGCCGKWMDHLTQNGFVVEEKNMPDVTPMKQRFGVPGHLTSCHTAVVDGYVVEGHVPADVIQRMLTERPDVTGIAVPGMPPGSPGMDSPNPQAYDVIAFDKRGGQHVYASM